MALKKLIYNLLPFIPKINLAIGSRIYQWKINHNRKSIKESLKDKTSIYTNIGCGSVGLSSGWINIDYSSVENVDYVFDCSKELPFATSSVKGIFTEHFFEHLDYFEEVPKFLNESHRVLQIDGCIRIIVPDAGKYLLAYNSKGWDMLKKMRPLNDDLIDGMGIKYNTKLELINEVFRQSGQHKYAWDYETMEYALKNAGFSKISKRSYLDSHDKTLEIDMEARRSESLYVEAIK